jgi:[ribosomal protein S5]-alanine N-acetyltransferase
MQFALRPFTEADVDSVAKYANNLEIAKNLTNKFPHSYSTENAKQFIAFATANKPVHIMAIDINGEAIGGIGIHPKDDIECKNAEMGYWLGEPFWGNGIITKAVLQMIDYGFANFEIDRIFARPFGTNIASQKVLEKTGFTLEAKFEKTLFKFGEYQDELIYAIRRKY